MYFFVDAMAQRWRDPLKAAGSFAGTDGAAGSTRAGLHEEREEDQPLSFVACWQVIRGSALQGFIKSGPAHLVLVCCRLRPCRKIRPVYRFGRNVLEPGAAVSLGRFRTRGQL